MTVLVGHFGSGKTEIALSAALDRAAAGRRVALVDLDVVKPFFRSRSARAIMAAAGVTVVAPEGENIFADLPIIVPQVRTLVADPDCTVIVDAGGDPTGARALGSVSDVLAADAEVLAVLNFRRPFTEGPEAAEAMVREIEVAARTRVTGLVSNTHLMDETTAAIVLDGYDRALETGRRLGLPVVAVASEAGIKAEVEAGLDCPVVELRRLLRASFDTPRARRTVGPLFVLN